MLGFQLMALRPGPPHTGIGQLQLLLLGNVFRDRRAGCWARLWRRRGTTACEASIREHALDEFIWRKSKVAHTAQSDSVEPLGEPVFGRAGFNAVLPGQVSMGARSQPYLGREVGP